MESGVGVGDVLRLFYENGHEHYLVTAVNYDNEIMLRGRDGLEEMLPTTDGHLSKFNGHTIVGFQIVRPTPKDFPQDSDVAVDLQSGKRLRGTVKANDDGILEIRLDKGTIFVDVASPHPLVKSVALYSDTAPEKDEATEITEFGSETELVDLRAQLKPTRPDAERAVQAFKDLREDYTDSAAGVYVRPPRLLTALSLPRWIFPLLENNYLKVLPVAGRKAKRVLEAAFFAEVRAALATQPSFPPLFDALCPFVTPSPARKAEARVHALSLRQQVYRRIAPVFIEVFVPPVADEPPEQIEFTEFALIPAALPMSRVFLPATPLYDRCLMHATLGAYHALIRRKAAQAETVTDLARVWENQTATAHTTVHDTIRSLEPYLCDARDVTVAMFQRILPKMALKVAHTKSRFKARAASSPSSAPTHVFPDKYEFAAAYSSEILAKILALDQGRRLFNKGRAAAQPRALKAEPSSLEVLPDKVVELFNAFFENPSVALVDTFGREPAKTENSAWLYFRPDDMLNHKFIPVVVERLLRARHNKGVTGYLSALEQLRRSKRGVVEDNLLLDRGSGFAIADGEPIILDRGSALVRDRPTPAYTQGDLAILSVVKAADPHKLHAKYEYIVQHVRGCDRPEDVVFSVLAYVALFANADAESVANAAAESVAYGRGKYWKSVTKIGPGALLSKIKEKMQYLARDYEFVRLNRQAEIQSGVDWPDFLPPRHPTFVDQAPVTPADQLHVYPGQLLHYFRHAKERAPDMQAKLAFLESARRPRTAETTTMKRAVEKIDSVEVDLLEEEVPETAEIKYGDSHGLLDPKRHELDAATVWRCEGARTPPPHDYIDHLAPGADLNLLADFVQNTALTLPTLISRGRARQAVEHAVSPRFGKKTAALQKKLDEYYSPILHLSASGSAQDYFARKSLRKPLGDNELSDHDAETTFVRTYLHRQDEFRAVVRVAYTALQKQDAPMLKACAARALALHLSDPPLDYECQFVRACVRMFQADAAPWSEQIAGSAGNPL